jgi:hypothetical protein
MPAPMSTCPCRAPLRLRHIHSASASCGQHPALRRRSVSRVRDEGEALIIPAPLNELMHRCCACRSRSAMSWVRWYGDHWTRL